MLTATLVHAQDEAQPSPEELQRARSAFEEGIALAQQADHRGAIAKFREVMSIRATPPVKYNLAVQLVEIEEFSEADHLLQSILEDEGTTAAIRQSAADLRLQIENEGGRLKIELGGETDGVHVVLDGRELPSIAEPIRVRIGDHHISVEREGVVIEERDIGVPFGDVVTERFIVIPPPEEVAEDEVIEEQPPAEEASSDGGLLQDWRFWTIAGSAVVVAVTLAVVLAVVLSGGEEELPQDFNPPRLTFP